MNLYENKLYMADIEKVSKLNLQWDKLKGKKIALSGGTGMIGSFLVDVVMYQNRVWGQDTHVYVFGRSEERCRERFVNYVEDPLFHFIGQDINEPIDYKVERIDYVIHGASNTHPMAYSTDPIGTIASNVIGTNNLLRWANDVNCERFVFLSSVEIYGENRQDVDRFHEGYLGYIDCNTVRAGYPESKRTGEALCQAYIKQMGMDVVIPRLSRVYGPTMLMTDTKALSQFLKKSVDGQDIVLKSEGNQLFSYSYVADAVSAIFKIMFDGSCGEAYNVVSDGSDIMLKDLAQILARIAGTRVVFEVPDQVEKAGYSTATKAVLDKTKLTRLGWKSMYNIEQGLKTTVDILRG